MVIVKCEAINSLVTFETFKNDFRSAYIYRGFNETPERANIYAEGGETHKRSCYHCRGS